MSHASARRRCYAGYETDDGFLDCMMLQKVGSLFFCQAADFANHDDAPCGVVVEEKVKTIYKIRTVKRVATYANAVALSQAYLRRLVHGFVRQRAGSRYHTDATGRVYVTGHDAYFTFVRLDYAGAVRADEATRRGISQHGLDANHVGLRNALRYAHDEGHLSRDGLLYGGGGGGRRNEYRAGVCVRFTTRVGHGGEYGKGEMRLSGSFRIRPAYYRRAVR